MRYKHWAATACKIPHCGIKSSVFFSEPDLIRPSLIAGIATQMSEEKFATPYREAFLKTEHGGDLFGSFAC
jgi:hypothetical protein